MRTASFTVVMVLAAYAAIFILTPRPLEWHLKGASWRLIRHVWPTVLLVIFCLANRIDSKAPLPRTSPTTHAA